MDSDQAGRRLSPGARGCLLATAMVVAIILALVAAVVLLGIVAGYSLCNDEKGFSCGG